MYPGKHWYFQVKNGTELWTKFSCSRRNEHVHVSILLSPVLVEIDMGPAITYESYIIWLFYAQNDLKDNYWPLSKRSRARSSRRDRYALEVHIHLIGICQPSWTVQPLFYRWFVWGSSSVSKETCTIFTQRSLVFHLIRQLACVYRKPRILLGRFRAR